MLPALLFIVVVGSERKWAHVGPIGAPLASVPLCGAVDVIGADADYWPSGPVFVGRRPAKNRLRSIGRSLATGCIGGQCGRRLVAGAAGAPLGLAHASGVRQPAAGSVGPQMGHMAGETLRGVASRGRGLLAELRHRLAEEVEPAATS